MTATEANLQKLIKETVKDCLFVPTIAAVEIVYQPHTRTLMKLPPARYRTDLDPNLVPLCRVEGWNGMGWGLRMQQQQRLEKVYSRFLIQLYTEQARQALLDNAITL